MPRFSGTKLGKLVKAIAVDDIHSWRGLQRATNYSEKELNYHLALLFNEKLLIKKNQEYYLISKIQNQYTAFYKSSQNNKEKKKPVTQHKKYKKTTLIEPQTITPISKAILEKTPSINTAHILKLSLVVACVIILFVGVTKQLTYPINSIESDSSDSVSSLPDSTDSDSGSGFEDSPDESGSGGYGSVSTMFIDKIAKVTFVQDGDTFQLEDGSWIRLADINTPEEGVSGYQTAKDELTDKILGKTVYLDVDSETDRYGRLVCVVYTLSGSNFKNINYALVTGDYAEYSPHDNDFDHTTWSLFEENLDTSESEGIDIPSGTVYIGNKASKKYHKLSCSSGKLISESNRVYFSSLSSAEDQGYQACDNCLPAPLDTSYTYVGHTGSKKYHLMSCTYGKSISPENRIYFNSKSEAENADYEPCGVCLKTSSGGSSSGGSYSGSVIGNKNSKVFHKPSCYHVGNMNPDNKVYFSSPSKAKAAGYRSCGTCNP